MFEKPKIAPSVLSADLTHLADELVSIERGGVAFVHIDVMDGHFVNNLSFGVPLVKAIKKHTDLPLDVHLMITNPLNTFEWYIDAGADMISVHAETASCDELAKIARVCHEKSVKFCVAIKPSTDTSVLDDIIADCDMVLVMSVEPGFSGQKFMPNTIDRLHEVCAIASAHGATPLIEVDGGVGVGNAKSCCVAGADVLVCGNAVFCAEDRTATITAIKVDAETGRSAGLKKLEALNAYM